MADSTNFARLKWRWIDRLMHDARLTPRTRLVGYEIGWHLNSKSGDAWPSQETIRRNLGIGNISTVKRAIAALRVHRYLDVRFDPRTRSNSYVPIFDPADGGAGAPIGMVASVPHGGAGAPIDGCKTDDRWVQNCTDDGVAGAPQSTLSKQSKDQSPRIGAPHSDPNTVRWQSVKNRLAISLSPAVVKSWFDPMELVTITGTEVVLRSPSRFAREHVENNHLHDRLSDAWRAEQAGLRVRLVDPIARAAE